MTNNQNCQAEICAEQTIDDLGRILLPRKLRQQLNWQLYDVLEQCVENDAVVMRFARKGKKPEVPTE